MDYHPLVSMIAESEVFVTTMKDQAVLEAAHSESERMHTAKSPCSPGVEIQGQDATNTRVEELQNLFSAETAARAAAEDKVAVLRSELDDERRALEEMRANLSGESMQLREALEQAREESSTWQLELAKWVGLFKAADIELKTVRSEGEQRARDPPEFLAIVNDLTVCFFHHLCHPYSKWHVERVENRSASACLFVSS